MSCAKPLFALIPLALVPLASGQTAVRAHTTDTPIIDAGIYHMATGTWTRPGAGVANFGPQVVYNNNAGFGVYFLDLDELMVDEGHIPSSGAVGTVGTNAGYLINGFSIGYCTTRVGGPDYQYQFYEGYAPCTNPTGSAPTGPAFNTAALGLPGAPASGVQACWTVTIDLENTTNTFCMQADGGDGFYDNSDPVMDSFGWSVQLMSAVGNEAIFRRADPNNAPEGDGTSFQNPGMPGTGLLTQDLFWITNFTTPASSGCFFFGGYANGNAYASFFMQLFAATADCGTGPTGPVGTNYCFSLPNSTNNIASISGTGSVIAANQNLTLTTTNVPSSANGIHYFGSNQVSLPFGDGIRCVAGQTFRLPFGQAVNGVLTQNAFIGNGAGALQAGATWNFQAWFRDPGGAGGTGFNLSNGLNVIFQ